MTSGDFAQNRENFCYRHPDRQSFVLCQRCLRTICPECQTQAPVGVICPECLANQRRDAEASHQAARKRMPRVRAASSVVDTRPLATYWLIGITAAAYLVQQLVPTLANWLLFYAPVELIQPWRAITMLFVHASWIHIGLNMLALWMIGRILEPLVGHSRFVVLYLISGLGGAVGVTLIAPGTQVVGASGAIFGLFGALLVIGRHIGADVAGIAIVIGINLVIGFLPGAGVAWQAHVGGLVAGAAVGFVYARTRARSQRGAQIGLTIAISVVLIALMVGGLFIPR
ncbi:rhomboid family intramembrane serine protease [Microbacterium sp. ASV49]|uniref:Rhomboid family intramembrane serine protease n=1 Tax=Microbacterium candidum TaxID=3041922 RepID=A0ABT7MUE9_9MICO|nr:rhomboid family intramembrane serine protease [Microbacterium sp. ASV49]MDL9978058.1 rhomboid family intramembrane serine protease [Microbacterium sp. ASV49]